MIEDLTVNKLYDLTNKLINLLEDELDCIDFSVKKKSGNRKIIIDQLGKIVGIVSQLKKLDEEVTSNAGDISADDQNIIRLFLEKRNS